MKLALDIETLKKIRDGKQKQIATLGDEIRELDGALQILQKYGWKASATSPHLAVAKGVCPFPDSCNKRDTCTDDYCNADVCSNGHAYHFS